MKVIIFFLSVLLSSLILCSQAYSLCVDVPKANIRMGPGTNYEKAWEVYRYMPFETVGTSTDRTWYAIKDLDGDVNWIHESLVSDAFHCAVVKTSQVNVRTGPGTRYRKSALSPALRYDSFKILKRQPPWINVRDSFGNTGWIHSGYLWIQ
jgi:SH3-like domain-containing protein